MKIGNRFALLSSFGWLSLAAPALLAVSQPAYVMAQAAPATIHGEVKDPGGFPLKSGEVRFTTDKTSPAKDRKYQYTFQIGADGTYKAIGIAPGDYEGFVFEGDKSVDFLPVTVKAGDDKTLDFDMSREEYIKAMSPEDRAALEAAKKKNAAAMAENSKIANINKVLVQGRNDEKTNPDQAVTELKPLTEQRPNEPVVWAALGEAQLAAGDAAFKAARAAKTPTNDPAIQQKYADAATSYQKALDLEKAAAKPDAGLIFAADLNMGQAYARSGKPDDAAKSYEAAAQADPTKAGVAYYNEAVVLYTANKTSEAAAAADKAIAADPKRADAYYIKGQSLIPGATMDEKTHKFVLPPGCLEAYQEYLELAPDGPHAQEVKDLLTNLGQPQKNSFKAGRK